MVCDYNSKFKRDFGNLMKQAEQENKAMDEKKSIALDFLKSVKLLASDAGYTSVDEYLEGWAKFVDWRLLKSGIPALGSLFIQEIIKNPTLTILTQQNENTTSKLDITVETKLDFRKDFLEKIYNGADNVRLQAVKSAEYNFSNAMLFDRENGKIIRNEALLNQKIKEYLLKLLDTLFSYLKLYYSKQKNRIASTNYDIYSLDSVKLYEDGKYTGIFEQLFPTASNIFNSFDRKRLITEYQYLTNALKAFNAFQTLLHFDEFLLNSFGDAITIFDMTTRFSSGNKYKITSKATSMFWSNLLDDDIDLAKSINNVSKVLITSTRMYDFKTGLLIPDTYLNFGLFISVITKIKDLSWNRPLTWRIKLNEKVGRRYVYDLSSLSKSSLDYIRSLGKNATFASLINESRRNPKRANSAIFELLSSKESREKLGNILELFNNEEKNVIMSLNLEIFKADGKSLRAILDIEGYTKDSLNYLNYVLLTTDSTWLVKNCQYFQNLDTNEVTLKTLLNSNILNVLRYLNDLVNIKNNPLSSLMYIKYNANYTSSGFLFTLGNHSIKIDNTGQVIIDNKGLLASMNSIQSSALLFIDDMLHLNFLNNPKYLDNYVSISGVSKFEALSLLFLFSAELLHGQYAVKQINELLKLDKKEDSELSKSEKISKYAKQYYSDYYDDPEVKYNYGTIDIVPGKRLIVLETLSEAKAITDGSTTATLVNDSEGKALSTSTPSRLLSAFELLLELIRNNPNSPAHGFSLVADPNTFVDIQTVREFNPAYEDSKTYNLFNTREFLESSILYDFIAPLINPDSKKYNLTKKGVVALTPSVNSDKNTISKLFINLLYELSKIVNSDGTQRYSNPDTAILDFIKDSPEGFYDYINKELGSYYSKMFKAISNDLAVLSNTLAFKSVLGEDFKLAYSAISYNEFNTRLDAYNLANPENKITARLLFDEASRLSGILVNELLHVIFGKSGILVNNSLVALYNRHKNNLGFLLKNNIPNISEYFQYKNTELLQSLVKNKVSIDIIENKQLYKFLQDNGLELWISRSGKLVFAKYNGIDITSETDLRRVELAAGLEYGSLTNNMHLLVGQVEMNPLIEKLNLVSYLYSLEFILSTVGSHINHPNKKAKSIAGSISDYMSDEAARFQALHKRNVSNTASMHEFMLNQFDGIPSLYNIAVILDINDLTYNLAGEVSVVKPFDGATFVNPFIVHLENNSLNGERAGIHKKQFVHFYYNRLGTGGIIKTAGFGITNSWMRNSPFMERMMKNMTDFLWTDELGNPTYVDITKRIQNGTGNNNTLSYPIVYSQPINENGIWKNRYYKVTNMLYLGNGNYNLEVILISKNGKALSTPSIETVSNINSNYKVWKYLFKGTNSLGLNADGSIDDSVIGKEQSIKNTVLAINECGVLKYGNNPEDLNNYYQPMKHSDTHYLVTEGAIKLGSANFNTKDWYYRDGRYNRYKIRMELAGIQLDKEHHADDSEISMMTQVISACAAKGYTWSEANSMYMALYRLAKQGIAPISEPLMKLLQVDGDRREFDKALANLIVKSLSNGSKSKDGVVYTIAYNLIEKYRNNEIIEDSDIEENPIPISDPVLFNKVLSLISSTLTSSAIKLKFKGILSVLVPSHETMKLYGGRLKGSFVNFEEEIKELQALYDANPLTIQDVEIGRTYKVVNALGEVVDRVHILAPFLKGKSGIYGNPNLKYGDYYSLRELLALPEYQGAYLIEDITEGRNLGAYFCTFEDIEGNKYNLYDLKDSYDLYHGQSTKKNLLETLANIKNGKEVLVTVDGVTKTIKVLNLQVKPYEVIMPKTMATLLSLTESDSVEALLSDENSFTKKLVSNLANKVPDDTYTVALKKLNGLHLYIITLELFDKLGINSETALKKVDPSDGKIYRIDVDGNQLYEMSSSEDKIYIANGLEIIITKNLDFYLNKSSYNMLYVSKNATSKLFLDIYKISRASRNKNLKSWRNAITHNNEDDFDIKNARQRNNLLGNIEITKDKRIVSNGIELDSISLDTIKELGAELYTSFKKSLDIVAARIPAQSMQSFMPMKVVGYEDFDINTAYVSTHQIWLLGSDYDIDAVSLLTYELGSDGKFIGWSPYFDISSELRYKISSKLGYPTGEKVKLKSAQELFGTERPEREKIGDYLTKLFSSFLAIKTLGNYSLTFKNENDDVLFSNFVDTINFISEKGMLDFDSLDNVTKDAFIKSFSEEFGEILPPSQMSNIFKALTDMVDEHNLYTNNQEAYTKNFVVDLMFKIASNIVNLVLSQTSVDLTTDEPKAIADEYSLEGKALKNATPGNMGNIYLSIEDNHVGKEVIGISAVGLKSFFAITQYVNTLLNTKSDDLILNTLLNRPIEFGGTYEEDGTWIPNKYYTIANANYRREVTEENREILERLHSMSEEDSALELSALLSLATDNAKELCLAKLNANPRMAGMYIYGLTMGIPYRDLGRLLMSDIGNTVSSLLKGSIISNKLSFNNIDEVLEYLHNPISTIKLIYKNTKLWQFNTGKTGNERVWSVILGAFFNNVRGLNGEYIKGFIEEKPINIKEGFNTFLSKNLERVRAGQEGAILDILNTLESLRAYSLLNRNNIDQNKYMINEAIDSLIDAFLLVDSLYRSNLTLWPNAFDDFITLHEGAAELLTLGGLLGANQGVKNSVADYLKFITNLENILEKRNKSLEKLNKYRNNLKNISTSSDTSLNFEKFMVDENYRNEKIQEYEKIRASFNSLDIINTVPHYLGYMDTVFTKHGTLLRKSIKYRTIYGLLKSTNKLTLGLKIDLKIRAISDLCDYKGINAYLQGKYFFISPGTEVVYLTNTLSSIKAQVLSPTKVYLGTLGGNATFKNWVELEVIPNLKEGYNDDRKSFKNTSIFNNEFIQSLRPNIYTKNPNKNSSVSYTTSINMSPRNDEDIIILLRVRQEFDALTTSYTVNGYSIPIKDIFYLYNLIAYNGKLGLGTLTSIFDNYLNSAEPTKYRKVIAELDNSDSSYEISTNELRTWVALVENPYGSKSPYLFYKNKSELRMEFLERSESDDSEISLGELRYGAYIINNSPVNIDTNLILTIPTSADTLEFTISAAEREWRVAYNPVTRKIYKLESEGIELELIKEIKKFLQNNTDLVILFDPNIKLYVFDQKMLASLIEEINCE